MGSKVKKPDFSHAYLDPALAKKFITFGSATAVVSIGLATALSVGHWGAFFHAYMVSYSYFLAIALGGLFFVILNQLVRAGWSVVYRRIAEGVASTMPVMLVLFLPVIGSTVAGSHALFEWNDHALHATDHLIHHKAPYLNMPFFVVRCGIYFGFWIYAARYFRKNSLAQDTSRDHKLTKKMEHFAAPCMFVFSLTLTFAAFDFIMALQPHWFSTIFGVYYFAAANVSFLALTILTCRWIQSKDKRMLPGVNVEHYHDIGKLLFGFNFFWSYIAFSQYMLIWYANIPEETEWYLERQSGGMAYVSVLLLLGHFAIPFLGLISRRAKRNLKFLTFWSSWLLVMHFVDMFYLISPAQGGHGPGHHAGTVHFGPENVLTFIGIGGAFLAALAHRLRGNKLIPVGDPRLPESLGFENV
ncbi:MAG: quinol:cytochrome C oxidoreductase [Myxococcota bacterium]